MKTRYLWTLFGLAFAITLAVIVGQRLSSEAMAVMVGVIAGVAASIPTSLIVVWFATRTTTPRAAPEAPRPAQQAEPRIIVMQQPAQPMPTPAPYQNVAGYPPTVTYPALPPRRFTVIGGAEVSLDEPEPPQEVLWQR